MLYAPESIKVSIIQSDPVSASILKALLYFKIFNYPVKKNELFNFASTGDRNALQSALSELIREGRVVSEDEFVWIPADQVGTVEKRLKGNKKAEKFLRTARRQAVLLSWFPFIKCICISGSLSKMYMDDHSDIDYFIIAQKERLWLTKLLMSVIVKTLEIFGLKKYFCPNYIITENNLTVTDRNIFTAMEIVTLIPLYNNKMFRQFLEANAWTKEYFPHYKENRLVKPREFKSLLKRIWGSRLFTWLNSKVFHFYKKRFAGKVTTGKIVAFDNNMVITENDCKLHLSGHRKRILLQYQKNVREFEEKYEVIL
jgi:hypothetical protein